MVLPMVNSPPGIQRIPAGMVVGPVAKRFGRFVQQGNGLAGSPAAEGAVVGAAAPVAATACDPRAFKAQAVATTAATITKAANDLINIQTSSTESSIPS
ncbi:MAG TPA: hypothetical protein VLJ39_19130 [Tepidisphaeraceae bacterium]|nr:hypothetical protein [Tepidisphaeraceae bacterium]